jgi:hypothetical protein
LAFAIPTNIAVRTEIVIAASRAVQDVNAPRFEVTRVVGADVFIVALSRLSRCARPVDATISNGAGIAVIARSIQRHLATSSLWVTAIISAGILIITVEHGSRNAPPCTTVVAKGTCVAVVTDRVIGGVGASNLGRTSVISAQIAIIAKQSSRPLTFPQGTSVTGSTQVSVVTWRSIEQV